MNNTPAAADRAPSPIARWIAAVLCIVYGFAKINGSQFTVLDSELAKPLAGCLANGRGHSGPPVAPGLLRVQPRTYGRVQVGTRPRSASPFRDRLDKDGARLVSVAAKRGADHGR